VAALAPGPGPLAPGAPRLVFSADAKVFALDGEGAWRAWTPAEAADLKDPVPVKDLALDRRGNLYVSFQGRREIWRMDPSGQAALHARIPGKGETGLAMALDPDSDDLYLGDASGLRRVSPAGQVSAILAAGPFSPSHLAVRGRELLLVDARRHELRVFHLDQRRLAVLVGSAGGRDGAPARLGPIRGLNPDLPADQCAALGGPGPVAASRDGLALLAVGDGLALLDLPGEAITPALAGPPRPAPARLSKRQQDLRRFRRIQQEYRAHKKAARLQRQRAARELAEAPARGPAPRASGPSRPSAGGLFCLTLLGLASLGNPALLDGLAPGLQVDPVVLNGTSPFAGYAAQAAAALEQLGPVCAAALASGQTAPPCAPGYNTGVLALAQAIQDQMDALFVNPSALGAGSCHRGERRRYAKAEIALAQSDVLTRFDGLSADAMTLQAQLNRDGFGVQAVGQGLLAGATGLAALAGNSTAAGIASFALDQVGESLFGAGFVLQVVGDLYGQVTGETLARRAVYQRWANSQVARLLNCTQGSSAPPGLFPASAAPVDVAGASPVPAMTDALQKLVSACALAQLHLLDLPVCSADSITSFAVRNGTISDLYARTVACLAVGLLQGNGAICPGAPLADARERSDTFAYFDQFFGEISVAASQFLGTGNALFAASVFLGQAGSAAAQAGSAQAAAALDAGASGLIALGSGIYAYGFELTRIGAVSRRWEADITLKFNAESLAALGRKEARRRAQAASSSTGGSAGARSSSAPGQPEPAHAHASSTAARHEKPVPVPAGTASSGAARARPWGPVWILGLFSGEP
jgi:hypothetical protein